MIEALYNFYRRCPECGKRFIFFNDDQYFYGSPVRTCKKCGNYYIYKRYHEFEIIMILTGKKTEKLDKLKLESEMRLKNKVYAHLLKQEGYHVPKQFL